MACGRFCFKIDDGEYLIKLLKKPVVGVLIVGNVSVSPHPIKGVPEKIYTYLLSF